MTLESGSDNTGLESKGVINTTSGV